MVKMAAKKQGVKEETYKVSQPMHRMRGERIAACGRGGGGFGFAAG